MSVNDVVVVGAGVAGVTAADTLRRDGFTGRILLVSAEDELPYRRPPLSKDVLRGEREGDGIRLKPAGWYADAQVELLLGRRAVAVDGSEVVLDDGARLAWDRLLLATGGRARRLPTADGALHLRSLADAVALRDHLRPGARIAVVGAGFVGAEVAASARALGAEVVLLEAAPLPLGRLLPPVVAEAYAALHRRHGVDVRLGAAVRSVEAGRVLLADGTAVEADAVVVGVGMEPDTALAQALGCEVGPEGVVVDADGATSVPGVFAAGDAACRPDARTGRHRRQEHWSAAQSSGAAAARGLLGLPASAPEVPWSWSDQHGVNLQVCGWPEPGDDVVVRGDLDAADATVLLGAEGRLVAGITVGRPREGRTLRALLAAGTTWAAVRAPEADLAALAG